MAAQSMDTWGPRDFDRLTELFRRTRLALDVLLRRSEVDEASLALLATEALAHVEDMEVGFRGWLRARQARPSEMRDLVRRSVVGLPEPTGPAERRAAASESMILERIADPRVEPAGTRRMVALQNARLVFAVLPRLPDHEVRFPTGRRTYGDIPAPRTPGELAARIEELERELWRAAGGREPHPGDEAYRRTYGFFDVAERLSTKAWPH